jgi:streptogrisin C
VKQRIFGKVARERPEIFIGSAVNPQPGGAPTLYVKGPADAFVDRLVAGAGIDVVVKDGQPYSFSELEERQLAVHKALVAYGFKSVATSVDLAGAGKIPAEVTKEPGVDSRPSAVLAAMPQNLRSHVALAVRDEPVTSLEYGYGGERMGNCDGINEIDWTAAGQSYPTTPQFRHRRAWGDIEYHFGPTVQAGVFYASSTDVRAATSVEAVSSISVGESVCQYGRSSNVRHCSPDVDSVSVTCTFAPFPYATERLVGTDNDVGIGGHSGGGWSFSDTAYGSHVGNCDNGEVFSAADYYDEALGISVWLAP